MGYDTTNSINYAEISESEWNRHRDNMHQSLKALLQRKKTDLSSYEYTCQIMAYTFNLSADVFMQALENEDTLVLADKLTTDEYGIVFNRRKYEKLYQR